MGRDRPVPGGSRRPPGKGEGRPVRSRTSQYLPGNGQGGDADGLRCRFDLAGQEGLLAREPADFAAGRLADRARQAEHDGVAAKLVLLINAAANGLDDLVGLGRAHLVGARLDEDHQTFTVTGIYGERSDAAGADQRVAVAEAVFDVGRVQVAPAHDDQVLAATGDIEFAVVEEAEIAGAEVFAVAGLTGDSRLERFGGRLGHAPVAEAFGR